MEQPRVNPSDWASRRKHAMNRARELRSRIREDDHDQGVLSDVSSLASKSEMQRQRRIRQLEATQRLLDGQVGGFDLTESSSGGSISGKGRSYRKDGHRQKVKSDGMQENNSIRQSAPYDHDEQPVGRRGGMHPHSSDSEPHSVISQQHLSRIHKRYQKPSASNDPLASTLDSSVRSNQYNHDEGRIRSTNESNGGVVQQFGPMPTNEMPENSVRDSLIQKPQGGRGRGRGRRKSPHDSSTSLGELSRSSKSLSHTSATVKDQMADSGSRSPSTTRINPSSPHRSQSMEAKGNTSEALAAHSYLRYYDMV